VQRHEVTEDLVEPVERGESFHVGMRWEATGVTADLFPMLDGDFTLTPVSTDGTQLALMGVYRPPFGLLGAGLDAVLLRKVAEAAIRSLVRCEADAIIEQKSDRYLDGARTGLPAACRVSDTFRPPSAG
jgi:hypothetical protein